MKNSHRHIIERARHLAGNARAIMTGSCGRSPSLGHPDAASITRATGKLELLGRTIDPDTPPGAVGLTTTLDDGRIVMTIAGRQMLGDAAWTLRTLGRSNAARACDHRAPANEIRDFASLAQIGCQLRDLTNLAR